MSFAVGARAAFRRVLLQSDFDRFARLTGDDNPIHCDPDYAGKTHFGATVAHGMMLYSLISKGFAELIPGPGALALEQELMFPNPAHPGEEITVVLEVAGIAPDGSLDLLTIITKPAGETSVCCAQGRARVACRELACGDLLPASPGARLEPGDAELYGLRPAMSAERSRRFTLADLEEYGDLTGDRNPLFRDDAYARRAGCDGRIVPWPLLAGMFSDLLGTRLPGRGTGWMKQRLVYPHPAYPGEDLTARVEVTRLRAGKELVNLRSTVTNADGRPICDGESLVLVRNLEAKLTGARPQPAASNP